MWASSTVTYCRLRGDEIVRRRTLSVLFVLSEHVACYVVVLLLGVSGCRHAGGKIRSAASAQQALRKPRTSNFAPGLCVGAHTWPPMAPVAVSEGRRACAVMRKRTRQHAIAMRYLNFFAKVGGRPPHSLRHERTGCKSSCGTPFVKLLAQSCS